MSSSAIIALKRVVWPWAGRHFMIVFPKNRANDELYSWGRATYFRSFGVLHIWQEVISKFIARVLLEALRVFQNVTSSIQTRELPQSHIQMFFFVLSN